MARSGGVLLCCAVLCVTFSVAVGVVGVVGESDFVAFAGGINNILYDRRGIVGVGNEQ